MAKAKHEAIQREAWQHTSAIMATIANLFVGKGQKPSSPDDFNPVVQAEKQKDRKRRGVSEHRRQGNASFEDVWRWASDAPTDAPPDSLEERDD